MAMQMSVHAEIQSLALARCASFPPVLRTAIGQVVRATTDVRITALPYVFSTALGHHATEGNQNLLEKLALANLYGWMAYDIYDDVLDGEGESSALPVGNCFLRELCGIYESVDREILGAKAAFDRLLNEIDSANVWEQERCRVAVMNGMMHIPDDVPRLEEGTVLSERSIGHALPALVLAAAVGFGFDSLENKAILEFFRHYLVARQLHDDARDWFEDVERGHINAVGAMVLRAWRSEGHPDIIEFVRDERSLKILFWKNVVERIVAVIFGHIALARHALASAVMIRNPAPLEGLLAELASAADRACAARTAVEQFLSGRVSAA